MKPFFIALLTAAAIVAHGDDTLKFQIKRYRVEGNTVLPDSRVQEVLAPFTGDGRDFGDVQRALEALESLYRKSGFGALQVYLPEQELNQGEIVLKVVEPKLGKVRIEGNQYYGEANIRHALPALRPGQVPNTGEIAENLRLANESPDRHVTTTMQAGDDPQTVDAVVKVEDDRPWHVFAAADNTGTSDTGRTRLSIGYQHSNLFDRDQVLTVQATTSPEKTDKVKIGGIGYKLPFYDWNDSLSFFAGYSSVSSGAFGLFNVSGKGSVAGVRFNHTLQTIGAYQQKLLLGLDWRKFDTGTSIQQTGTSVADNSYLIRPLSLSYQGQAQFARWSYDFNAGVSRNIPLGASLGDPTLVTGGPSGRAVADDDYLIWRYGGNVYATLPGEWAAHFALNGQATSDALPPGDQFGLGGAATVRGYEERELSNDEGVSLSAEAYTPEMGSYFKLKDLSLRGLAFLDWGHLSRNHVLSKEDAHEELAGAGVGVRVALGKRASLKLDVAQALKDAGTTKKGDTKAHIAAIVSY